MSMMRTDPERIRHMRQALELARKGEGRTAPNPPVGAVVVRNGKVVGEGFHSKAGEPHAEIFALQQAAERAHGADLYVTLEPCSHHGKTPPCVDAVIMAGVKRVFVGAVDPNPKVSGRGIERLRQSGIEVHVGLLESDCQRLIVAFTRLILTGRPLTIYKSAMTLDGNTATWSGDSRWISGEKSRLMVHRLRDRVEAVMIGSGTALRDDPLLNTRLPENNGRDPLRVVVDSQLRIAPDCRMLKQRSLAGTLIATAVQSAETFKPLQDAGAEILVLPDERDGVDLPALWQELGKRNVQRLLLEGGARLATAALKADLIDQMMIFIAPKVLGGSGFSGLFAGQGCAKMSDALNLTNIAYVQIDKDLLITGDVERCSPA